MRAARSWRALRRKSGDTARRLQLQYTQENPHACQTYLRAGLVNSRSLQTVTEPSSALPKK
jgi:hypothetical protein